MRAFTVRRARVFIVLEIAIFYGSTFVFPTSIFLGTAQVEMKLVHSILLVAAAFVIGGDSHNQASAWSPSVAMTSTTAALWKKQSNVLLSTNGDSESMMTTAETVVAEPIDAPLPSNNTTIASQISNKSLALFSSLLTTSQQILSSSQLHSAVAVFGGTVLTYYLNNQQHWGPILASSAVGLVSALALPLPLALASFCGSFAGMAKSAVVPTTAASAILGLVCAAMMALFDRQQWLVGVGGRLGFMAQCACTLQFVVTSVIKPNFASGASLVGSFGDPLQVLRKLPLVCLYTLGGALLMSLWKEALAEQIQKNAEDQAKAKIYRRMSNSVAASSVTGLLAATLLPATAAGPVFCGSFIAMSAPAKLETYGSLIGASVIGGVCQQAMSGLLLGGWGGRLGTAALVGVLSYRRIASVSKKKLAPKTA
jgi:hypothetical protein